MAGIKFCRVCLFSVFVWVSVAVEERRVLRQCDKALSPCNCVWGDVYSSSVCDISRLTTSSLSGMCVFCVRVSLTPSLICVFSSHGFAYPWQTPCTFPSGSANIQLIFTLSGADQQPNNNETCFLATMLNTVNTAKWFWIASVIMSNKHKRHCSKDLGEITFTPFPTPRRQFCSDSNT